MAVRARWRATSDASDAEDDDLRFDIVVEDSSLQFEWLEVENEEVSDYETALANPSQLNLGPDGITHLHWKHPSTRRKCSCGKEFGALTKPRNCRRCGELFCKTCTKNVRRLNRNAQFDVEFGIFHPVCRACFAEPVFPQSVGVVRSFTDYFASLRKRRAQAVVQQSRIMANCHRLAISYTAYATRRSSLTSAMMSSDDWEKVNFTRDPRLLNADKCPCGRQFSLLTRRKQCRICGFVFCSQCVSESVVLFLLEGQGRIELADQSRPREGGSRVFGCATCIDDLSKALTRHNTESAPKTTAFRADSAMPLIARSYTSLQACHPPIDTALPTYAGLVAAIDGPVKNDQKLAGELALLDSNLEDWFAMFDARASKIRSQMKLCKSGAERQIVSNIVKAQINNYYRDTLWEFRALRKRLHLVMTPEQLRACCDECDFNALRCAFSILRQIAFESCAFTELSRTSAELKSILEAIEEKLAYLCVERQLVWEHEKSAIDQVLAELLKENPVIVRYLGSANWQAPVCSIIGSNLVSIARQMEDSATIRGTALIVASLRAVTPSIQPDTMSTWDVVDSNDVQ